MRRGSVSAASPVAAAPATPVVAPASAAAGALSSGALAWDTPGVIFAMPVILVAYDSLGAATPLGQRNLAIVSAGAAPEGTAASVSLLVYDQTTQQQDVTVPLTPQFAPAPQAGNYVSFHDAAQRLWCVQTGSVDAQRALLLHAALGKYHVLATAAQSPATAPAAAQQLRLALAAGVVAVDLTPAPARGSKAEKESPVGAGDAVKLGYSTHPLARAARAGMTAAALDDVLGAH